MARRSFCPAIPLLSFYIKNKKTPCEYCEYKTICQFKAGTYGNNYKYIGRQEKQEILDKIKS